jgi:signal peptidase I
MYFCLGDNRDNSRDSRYWGFLPRKLVRGKALVIFWSWGRDTDTPVYDLVHKIRWKRIGRTI